jgi:KDO2-lipid IV(A) lauroyltransferase
VLARKAMMVAGIPSARAEILSRKFVLNAAVRVMDDLVLGRGWRPRLAHLAGIEYLQGAQAAGRGVLVLTGHFYASRAAKRYLEIAGYSILTVRNSKPRDELMGRIGKRFLQSRYIEFLHRVIRNEVFIQDPGCTLKIFQHLRRGGLVNIHFDSFGGHRTVERPFLGAPRLFSKGLLDIVRLSGCEVVPMSCTGTSINLRIAFSPAIDITPAADGEAFVNANLNTLANAIEVQVLTCPEEWELWTRL